MWLNWSKYEVTWETGYAALNRFFAGAQQRDDFARKLAEKEYTLRVVAWEHPGPHGGTSVATVVKGPGRPS